MTLDIASLRAIREREATTVSLSTNPAELDRRLLLVHVDTLEHRIRELETALQTVLQNHETLTSDEWDSLERKWCATLDRGGGHE